LLHNITAINLLLLILKYTSNLDMTDLQSSFVHCDVPAAALQVHVLSQVSTVQRIVVQCSGNHAYKRCDFI
jgi:hypothetical protein